MHFSLQLTPQNNNNNIGPNWLLKEIYLPP